MPIRFSGDGDGTVYHLPWTELLHQDGSLIVDTEQVFPGLNVLAPWSGPKDTHVQYSDAVILDSGKFMAINVLISHTD